MIPEGWTATTIGQHADVLTGFAFKSAEYTADEQDVKLLRGDNVSPHRLRWRDVKRFPKDRSTEVSRYQLRAGDFVVAMDRTWLPSGVKIAEVTEADLPCLLVQRVARLRAKDTLHQGLMKQFFSGHQFDQHVQAVQTETAVPHISPADLRDYPIKLPPLPEQRRIAEILSTWDGAIETTQKLIANARAQKKALMQSLLPQGNLTPKHRLAGFGGEWASRTIGEVATVTTGKSKSEFIDPKGEFLIVDMGSVTRTGALVSRKPTNNAEDALHLGDLIMPKDDIGGGNIIGLVAKIDKEETYVLGDHVYLLRSKPKVSPDFLQFVINSHAVNKSLRRKANGTAQLGLGRSDVQKALVRLPDYPEQCELAAILVLADKNLLKLHELLAALRQEKSALMQQLLTGKRRVKLAEKEHA